MAIPQRIKAKIDKIASRGQVNYLTVYTGFVHQEKVCELRIATITGKGEEDGAYIAPVILWQKGRSGDSIDTLHQLLEVINY